MKLCSIATKIYNNKHLNWRKFFKARKILKLNGLDNWQITYSCFSLIMLSVRAHNRFKYQRAEQIIPRTKTKINTKLKLMTIAIPWYNMVWYSADFAGVIMEGEINFVYYFDNIPGVIFSFWKYFVAKCLSFHFHRLQLPFNQPPVPATIQVYLFRVVFEFEVQNIPFIYFVQWLEN